MLPRTNVFLYKYAFLGLALFLVAGNPSPWTCLVWNASQYRKLCDYFLHLFAISNRFLGSIMTRHE